MLVKSSFKKNNLLIRKIATVFVVIIFVLDVFVSYGYAVQNRTQNFLNYKLDKVRKDVPYEIIQNEDGTKTYIVYNYDGDLYEENEVIKTPYEIIKLKKATSSIILENPYLSVFDIASISEVETNDFVDLDTDDTKIIAKTQIYNINATNSFIQIDKNISYDKENSDIEVLKIKTLCADKYYPVVFRKKSIFKIPKEIIKNIKKMDILIVFNVARNDIKPTDMWKFRYIEDVMVNAGGNHTIDTKDDKRTTCLQLKYQYKHEDVSLMRFEYHQANDRSGYAYVDIDHVLDREELMNRVTEYDIDDVNRYIDNLDYKFISDEWMVSYDNGDVDFYLRKWVTYKVNIYKDVFENAMVEIGKRLKNMHFDSIGYVDKISMF